MKNIIGKIAALFNQSTTKHRFTVSPFYLFALSVLFVAFLVTAAQAQRTDIAGAAGSGEFGTQVVTLPNGNFVVADPSYDEGGRMNVGAVYLYNGATLARISTLKGSAANDNVGSGTIVILTGGNHFVVSSQLWNNGGTMGVGAVTLCSATTGCNGTVSPSNSLIGATLNDSISHDGIGNDGITVLTNGNYVVRSRFWDNTSPAATNAGAITFCNTALNSCAGQVVSASNSLVGTTAGDISGNNITMTVLANGNFFVRNQSWDNGAATDAGAVTFCSGTTGCTGAISAANSVIGSTANDKIGYEAPTVLSNGNVVFQNTTWDNTSPAAADAGAVTFCSGTSGCNGVVSALNSLVGSTLNDNIGSWTSLGGVGITPLSNGNYVVPSSSWDNGATANVGAVTLCSGTSGCTGAVSTFNSLVGSRAGDGVGSGKVAALTNGNYVVSSQNWSNGATASVGAVTLCNGTSNSCAGVVVSPANSLVGSRAFEYAGDILALTNGNYVVSSQFWWKNGVGIVGAVTLCNGTSNSCAGVVISPANSLVGSTHYDRVGKDMFALTNGNYVVSSPEWKNGTTAINVGAVTFCSGTTGCNGVVSASNSLVGSTALDYVGGIGSGDPGNGITTLANGNYLVHSPNWDNGSVVDAGGVTWCSGTSGCTGPVTTANSLVGSTSGDNIGMFTVTTLSNGNFVIPSTYWSNGATNPRAGALTFCDATAGCPTGVLSASNSLVGTKAGDLNGLVTALTNGNYVVTSRVWDNSAATDAGAVTWCSGTTGCTGAVSPSNSLVGSTTNDGSDMTATALSNGNYTVLARFWNNPSGPIIDAGFAAYGDGANGTFGTPNSVANSNRTVLGTTGGGVNVVRFDAVNNQLIVGRSASNIVTVLRFGTRRSLYDFDGDGKADIAVFRPSNGVWYINQSTSGFSGVSFGLSTDKLVPADYDGDGKTDIAVYRNGTWYLQRSQAGFTGISFGDANDIPQPADYDGDGKADIAVFRPSNGVWYVQRSQLGFTGIQFGQAGDKPVAADYDGDGKADVAVFRNGTWYLQRSQAGFTGISFGEATDKPVAADYDGDGKADVAVFRPSNGVWYLNRTQAGFTGVQFGLGTDLPVAADYDGDGKADVAVFRDGIWYLQRSQLGFTGIGFGAATDRPVPNASVP